MPLKRAFSGRELVDGFLSGGAIHFSTKPAERESRSGTAQVALAEIAAISQRAKAQDEQCNREDHGLYRS